MATGTVKASAWLHGGGGFFLACEDFGEIVRQFIPRLRLKKRRRKKVEISWRTLIPPFRPGSVHMTQQAETTVTECSLPDESRVSSFPDRLPNSAWTLAKSAAYGYIHLSLCTHISTDAFLKFASYNVPQFLMSEMLFPTCLLDRWNVEFLWQRKKKKKKENQYTWYWNLDGWLASWCFDPSQP